MTKNDLEAQVATLLAWKERQEQDQADRLVLMRNAIVEMFAERHATISEMSVVLDMIRLDSVNCFVAAQKEKSRIASKEYPAKIKE